MAVATSSGMAAQLITLSQFMQCGDNFVSASHLYGGTSNQFRTLFKQYGIECRFSEVSRLCLCMCRRIWLMCKRIDFHICL